MSDKTKTPDELRAEIAQIDADLQKLAEREREAEHGIGELSLAARRGDKKAAAKLDKYDAVTVEALSNRRRLQAARSSVESELAMALALERGEETKAKAREAQEMIEIFRKRGAAIDTAFRTATDEVFSLQADAMALQRLGARVNPALVTALVRRAVQTALIRLKVEHVPLIPPLERRSFDQLCAKWADGAERWASEILDGRVAPTPPAQSVEAPPPSTPPLHRNIHVGDGSDPNFEIRPAEPRVH